MDIQARAALKAQLKIDEGFVAVPTPDPFGVMSIGHGHKILHGEVFDHPLSEMEADEILDADVNKHVNDLQVHLPWCVNMPELCQQSLANMAFNMGLKTLLKFDIFLDFLKKGDYSGASMDLTRTLWHRQVGNRALRIEKIFADEGEKDVTAHAAS